MSFQPISAKQGRSMGSMPTGLMQMDLMPKGFMPKAEVGRWHYESSRSHSKQKQSSSNRSLNSPIPISSIPIPPTSIHRNSITTTPITTSIPRTPIPSIPSSPTPYSPNRQPENQNRKILEELQKKQQALKQPNASAGNLSMKSGLSGIRPPPLASNPSTFGQLDPLNHHLPSSPHPSNGHKPLNTAAQNSFGNFIPQDSAFGNQILPVLPLFN